MAAIASELPSSPEQVIEEEITRHERDTRRRAARRSRGPKQRRDARPSSGQSREPERRPRVAVYLRISRDPDGTSTGTERQLEDCRKFADLRGWDIVAVFEDPDVSAFQRNVKREKYDEMLERMDEGEFDVILVWRLDRLVRRTTEFALFWMRAEPTGIRLASATQPIDTSDPVGMLIVQILIAFAQMESETMSIRIKAWQREQAQKGRPRRSGSRAYGMRAGWDELEPAEEVVIREMAERLLAGEKSGPLVNDLNDRGIPAPAGGRWTRRSFNRLMRQGRLFGWREHLGELVAKGAWPVILDEATGRAVRELLDARAGPNHNGYRHLLSGILRCCRCDSRLRTGRGSDGARRYVCPPKADGGCSGISINADASDEAVDEMVAAQLETPGMAQALAARRGRRSDTDEAEILTALSDLEGEREQNSTDKADGLISRETFLAMQRAIDRRVDELTARLTEARRTEPLLKLIGNGAESRRERYLGLPVDRKKAVIESLVDRIVVYRKESPKYVERLRESLAEEAVEFEELKVELRRKAAETDDPDESRRLRAAATEAGKAASRRRSQVRDGTGGGRFRPERLDPIWLD